MEIQPLGKHIYEKAKALGVKEILLAFSGGNDEGYLNVFAVDKNGLEITDEKFIDEIRDWAWDSYQYSGAGDGNDYGDDITYNLKDGIVTAQEWYMKKTEGETGEEKLKIE